MARHALTLEAVVRSDRVVRRAVEAALDDLAPGLSQGDWRTLYELARSDEIVAKWLSIEMGRSQQQTSNHVKRLLQAGLVSQAPDPADPRRKRLTLTPAGQVLEARLTERARAALARASR